MMAPPHWREIVERIAEMAEDGRMHSDAERAEDLHYIAGLARGLLSCPLPARLD